MDSSRGQLWSMGLLLSKWHSFVLIKAKRGRMEQGSWCGLLWVHQSWQAYAGVSLLIPGRVQPDQLCRLRPALQYCPTPFTFPQSIQNRQLEVTPGVSLTQTHPDKALTIWRGHLYQKCHQRLTLVFKGTVLPLMGHFGNLWWLFVVTMI